MITLSEIKKHYGNRLVLDIPALSIGKGSHIAVIGANGSGKTTLLRIIAGTLAPGTGIVSVPEAMRQNRGYMPQHPYIFGFSVLRNVTMALSREERVGNAAEEALEAVGMASFMQAKGKNLSGGEAQRVALARVLALPRTLLLLDEPTSSTDIAGNDLVESAIRAYCYRTGCTLVFSTHSPAQAMRLSDSVVMLHDGHIVESGPTAEVICHPKSREGNEFLQHWKI